MPRRVARLSRHQSPGLSASTSCERVLDDLELICTLWWAIISRPKTIDDIASQENVVQVLQKTLTSTNVRPCMLPPLLMPDPEAD